MNFLLNNYNFFVYRLQLNFKEFYLQKRVVNYKGQQNSQPVGKNEKKFQKQEDQQAGGNQDQVPHQRRIVQDLPNCRFVKNINDLVPGLDRNLYVAAQSPDQTAGGLLDQLTLYFRRSELQIIGQ